MGLACGLMQSLQLKVPLSGVQVYVRLPCKPDWAVTGNAMLVPNNMLWSATVDAVTLDTPMVWVSSSTQPSVVVTVRVTSFCPVVAHIAVAVVPVCGALSAISQL